MDKARAAAAASGGGVSETTDREAALAGAHVVYAKEWGSAAHYGDAEAEAKLREPLADWLRARGLVPTARGRTATSCTACRCGETSPSRTRCSTGRAAA